MSLSDISDLTDLSSDEEPLTVRTSKKKLSDKARQDMQAQLRPPRTSQYSARAIYEQLHDSAINLDPEYQRDVVWSDGKQSGLIDSLFHNYYVPPIVFAVYTTPEGEERRTCIDGKQRLTSIQQFMTGNIPHKDSFTNIKNWYKNPPGQSRKMLPSHMKKIFDNKQIVCVEYENLSEDQEREIFQRVQLGVALTPAERMQAITSPWATLIREAQRELFSVVDQHLGWASSRGRDFQCLTSIALLIDKYPSVVTNPSVSQLEAWLKSEDKVAPRFRENLHKALRILNEIVLDPNLSSSLRNPTRVSPIEMVMIGLLTHVYSNKCSLTQLSALIGKLREDVRKHFVDIRANNRIGRHMLDFIKKKAGKLNLPSDGHGDQPAGTENAPTLTPAPKKTKRKRVVESNDSESEELTQPPVSKPKTSRPVTEDSVNSTSRKGVQAAKVSQTKFSAVVTPKGAAKPKIPPSSGQGISSQVARPTVKPSISQLKLSKFEPKSHPQVCNVAQSENASSSQLHPKSPITSHLSTNVIPPLRPGPVKKDVPVPFPVVSTPRPLPPPIKVKPEPRNTNSPPIAPEPSSAGPLGPSSSMPQDRLAPIRAAKAGASGPAKLDNVAPTASPALGFNSTTYLQQQQPISDLPIPPPLNTDGLRQSRFSDPLSASKTAVDSPIDSDVMKGQIMDMLAKAGYSASTQFTTAKNIPVPKPPEAKLLPNGLLSSASDMSISSGPSLAPSPNQGHLSPSQLSSVTSSNKTGQVANSKPPDPPPNNDSTTTIPSGPRMRNDTRPSSIIVPKAEYNAPPPLSAVSTSSFSSIGAPPPSSASSSMSFEGRRRESTGGYDGDFSRRYEVNGPSYGRGWEPTRSRGMENERSVLRDQSWSDKYDARSWEGDQEWERRYGMRGRGRGRGYRGDWRGNSPYNGRYNAR